MSTRVKKGYVDGPFGQLHYYEAGSGVPLILLHQSPVSARMFEQALPLLGAAGICAIAMDTPGYGNSDSPDAPPTVAEYAFAIDALLDGLGIEAAHVLGHHTGAAIAASFAERSKQRVSSLILNGPPLFSAPDLEQFAGIKHHPPAIHADGSHLQEAWDRRTHYSPGWQDARIMHRRLVDQLWAGDAVWFGHYSAFRHDIEPNLKALTGRVLILTNTGDDLYALAQRAHLLRPDFEFVELDGGTHDIVDEQPALWSRVVADFVLQRA